MRERESRGTARRRPSRRSRRPLRRRREFSSGRERETRRTREKDDEFGMRSAQRVHTRPAQRRGPRGLLFLPPPRPRPPRTRGYIEAKNHRPKRGDILSCPFPLGSYRMHTRVHAVVLCTCSCLRASTDADTRVRSCVFNNISGRI